MRHLSARVAWACGFVAGASSILAVHAQSESPCRVVISSPRERAQVSRRVEVHGTANLPAGAVLWVLAHRADLTGQWWPQGAASLDRTGAWTVTAEFGRARDTNHSFVIAAVAVNDDTHRRLLEWLAVASERDYPPMLFPMPIEACGPVTVRVQKAGR